MARPRTWRIRIRTGGRCRRVSSSFEESVLYGVVRFRRADADESATPLQVSSKGEIMFMAEGRADGFVTVARFRFLPRLQLNVDEARGFARMLDNTPHPATADPQRESQKQGVMLVRWSTQRATNVAAGAS